MLRVGGSVGYNKRMERYEHDGLVGLVHIDNE